MAIERSELRLVWPPGLFAAEARALVATDAEDDALGGLLAEAFDGNRGEQLLRQVASLQPRRSGAVEDDPWPLDAASHVANAQPFASRASAALVADLAEDADRLPRHVPRPLFRQRHQPSIPALLSVATAKDGFARLVVELSGLGYFEDAFGSQCPDSCEDPDSQGQWVLAKRLEVDLTLWPLRVSSNVFTGPTGVHEDWPDELFFDVIEALHEVVARPRRRRWHGFHEGWDYDDYSRSAGQAVYRWKVNELLDGSDVPLKLAETGSDAGLLVQATGDPRDQLTERALATGDPRDGAEVQHAVALFRGRGASREDRRSAVVALARVLEHRRTLLKDQLLSGDEGALFQIANQFDLRHRNERQQGDYDAAFLDWVFWWYLGTIELADRLVARQLD